MIASSITYVGFIGVLTGVRKGLSMSLNFRSLHQAGGLASQLQFYAHHLLVLLGLRPSIASLLRGYLIDGTRQHPRGSEDGNDDAISLEQVVDDISHRRTTACYLIFSDGESTVSLDKDLAEVTRQRRSDSFIATTNHDDHSSAQICIVLILWHGGLNSGVAFDMCIRHQTDIKGYGRSRQCMIILLDTPISNKRAAAPQYTTT